MRVLGNRASQLHIMQEFHESLWSGHMGLGHFCKDKREIVVVEVRVMGRDFKVDVDAITTSMCNNKNQHHHLLDKTTTRK